MYVLVLGHIWLEREFFGFLLSLRLTIIFYLLLSQLLCGLHRHQEADAITVISIYSKSSGSDRPLPGVASQFPLLIGENQLPWLTESP